jgi:hypothetical protein
MTGIRSEPLSMTTQTISLVLGSSRFSHNCQTGLLQTSCGAPFASVMIIENRLYSRTRSRTSSS